ncbi:MAG: modification methylase [Cenarchaeum symbiont of Oopsacas minuta]|nr:modification methylase [Cenarchaeum symbiont of Oopsacas minuta]
MLSSKMSMLQTHLITKKECFELKSRRYIGNKSKLIKFIKDAVYENCGHIESFCDIFAGTGSVSQAFNDSETKILSNDYLLSNYYALRTFLFHDDSYFESIVDKINYLNLLKPSSNNYFSIRYGGTFFTKNNAIKIGTIRNAINRITKNQQEKEILITSLVYAMDKLANTVGHYDAYRKECDCIKAIKLKPPQLEKKNKNHLNQVLQEDANVLIKNVYSDVIYLDPPYNSRQYCDAYHLLENLSLWEKPKTFGKAQKMNRDGMKSEYCLKNATSAFYDLVINARCKHIFLSYNNTGNLRNARSNARINDNDIIKILRKKGRLRIFESKHKEFTTGKSYSTSDHTERLFWCMVR